MKDFKNINKAGVRAEGNNPKKVMNTENNRTTLIGWLMDSTAKIKVRSNFKLTVTA